MCSIAGQIVTQNTVQGDGFYSNLGQKLLPVNPDAEIGHEFDVASYCKVCCEFLVGFCKNVLMVENPGQVIENCYQLRNLTDNYTVYPAILILATLLFFA